MQMERLFGQVTDRQVLIELADAFNNRRVEINVLAADEPVAVGRRPHPHIAGRVQINGDILGSVPESDWDLPG